MAFVTASDGIRLHAEAVGEGIPVLFSCGYTTTRENFRPQVAPLVEAGARVVLWDYRGHGGSDAPHDPESYSMERVLSDLERVLDWGAGREPAVLVGFSFGGVASLHFALRHPERVRGLVLLDSGPGFKNPDAQARWITQTERMAGLLEERGFEGFLGSRAAASAVGRNPESPAAQGARAAIGGQDPRAVAQFGRRVAGPVPGLVDELGKIDAPALVVVGEEDEPYRRAAELMTSRLPRARQVVIPGAGHVVTLEAPDAVNRELAAFVRSLAAQTAP